ncbi:MAG: chorismate synthase [Candidatus Cryptobacteroides sp.]
MNTFGKNFRVSVFGESHGNGIGVLLDGVPAGVRLCEEDFMTDIARRKSGRKGTTPRIEADEPRLMSGVFNGFTTGAPLCISFTNTNTRSSDYELFRSIPRPGHADYVAGVKWNGFNDPRGGGHFSGRLTLPVVAAGTVAKKIVDHFIGDVDFCARLIRLGGIGEEFKEKWEEIIRQAVSEGDSVGAVVECRICGVPVGLGEPFWDSVESLISHVVFAIPGVRGIEFGDGFAAAEMRGSEHNDAFGLEGKPSKNGAGGINGGITNGADIVFRVAFKPTSSISKAQSTFNFKTGKMEVLNVPGRHDACFALRAPVVVEAVSAIVVADLAYNCRFSEKKVDF